MMRRSETKPDPVPEPSAGKPFLDHLEDLRRALVRSALALVAGMAIVAPFAPRVFDVLKRPLAGAGVDPEGFLRTIDVAGALSLALRIVFWGGLVLAAPFMVFFLGAFVSPGLTPGERKAAARAILPSFALFFFGVALGYGVTLPVALRVMLQLHRWMGIRPEWVVTSYASFALQLLLAFGLAFQLPVVVVILGRLGWVTAAGLRVARPYVIVGLLVLAMILTPPDVITQVLMAAPLMAMYEMCILLIAAWERGRAKEGKDSLA